MICRGCAGCPPPVTADRRRVVGQHSRSHSYPEGKLRLKRPAHRHTHTLYGTVRTDSAGLLTGLLGGSTPSSTHTLATLAPLRWAQQCLKFVFKSIVKCKQVGVNQHHASNAMQRHIGARLLTWGAAASRTPVVTGQPDWPLCIVLVETVILMCSCPP